MADYTPNPWILDEIAANRKWMVEMMDGMPTECLTSCAKEIESLRAELAKRTEERDEAKDKPLALTPQPICTAPRDGTAILVWDGEWNAWVAARWLVVCEINKGLDSGGWYGDHDCSWKGNCLDARTPQWWLPMPPEPTKILNGIVVNRGKAVPPKFELGEDDE